MNTLNDVWRSISLIMETLKEQAEFAGRTHARLIVLRKAIASLHENPEIAEEEIRRLEANAEDIVLSGSGFPESDAILRLLKAGKSFEKPDA